jgi:hypothetical protein
MRGDIKKLKKRIKLGFCCWEPKNQGGVITGANEEGIRSGEDADFFSHDSPDLGPSCAASEISFFLAFKCKRGKQ